MIEQIKHYIKLNNMLHQRDKIVIGLSGGADSVCLLMVLCSLKVEFQLEIRAVHINHMIRGDEAKRDQTYACDLAAKVDVPIDVFCIDIVELANELRITTEEAGRKYRYECFEKVLVDNNYNKIAVAHNKNDVAETVIFNMIRGSGIKGMAGILPVRGNIIRPLLAVERSKIEDYLKEINVYYCTDSTNNGYDYDRNKIRNKILPNMNDINSKSIEHIYNMAQNAREYYEYILQTANEFVNRNLQTKIINGDKAYTINIEQLADLPLVIQKEVVMLIVEKSVKSRKDITNKHIMDIIGLLSNVTGKMLNLPYGLIVASDYKELVFIIKSMEKNSEGIDCQVIDIDNSNSISFNWNNYNFIITRINCNNEEDKSQNFQMLAEDIEKKQYTKYVDYDKMLHKPCVRLARPDDYIVINKEGNRKKLNRLFIDMKISKLERENVPVIACGNEVVWVVGLRLGYNYKVTNNTKNVVVFNCNYQN